MEREFSKKRMNEDRMVLDVALEAGCILLKNGAEIFRVEETVYRNEGVEFQHVDFIDNSEVLDMLENRFGGLFCAIDDQVKIRGGTDENLMKAVRIGSETEL